MPSVELHLLIEQGNLKGLEGLFPKKEDPNFKGIDLNQPMLNGELPLAHAVRLAKYELISLLIKNRANPFKSDCLGLAEMNVCLNMGTDSAHCKEVIQLYHQEKQREDNKLQSLGGNLQLANDNIQRFRNDQQRLTSNKLPLTDNPVQIIDEEWIDGGSVSFSELMNKNISIPGKN